MYKILFAVFFTLNCAVVNAEYSSEKIWISIKSNGGIVAFLKKMATLTAKNLPQRMDAETEAFSVSSVNRVISVSVLPTTPTNV